ncbi:hypothetical protein AB0K00_45045 [Dactylosporangium sp. NPDC049525]|uniref:hypothetical protein n=1 Tax=Dactylosporangium sp. NPDC049525 TaxID=3154730 RepID=UPI00344542DC
MADEQHLDLIDNAFSNFREDGPLPAPLGTGAVRTTVRHRHRVRVMTAGALAALAVAAPITAYATGRLDSNGPPTVPGATATVSESAAPEPTTVEPTKSAPDGRITQTDLGNAVLDLPKWVDEQLNQGMCPTGRQQFSKGRTKAADDVADFSHIGTAAVKKVVHADVDGDGAQETVAVIECITGELGVQAVVGFDRDASGAIVTMGLVVGSDLGGAAKGRPEVIRDIRVAGTKIEAELGDLVICCVDDEQPVTNYHWRTYSWTGTAFAQTGGPTAMPQNPRLTNLGVKLTGTPVRVNGTEITGALTATIHNAGPTAQEPVLWLTVPAGISLKNLPSNCRLLNDVEVVLRCELPKLQVGKDTTFKVDFAGPAATFPVGTQIEAVIHVYTNITDRDHDERDYYGDTDPRDNFTALKFTVSS